MVIDKIYITADPPSYAHAYTANQTLNKKAENGKAVK
jgi:hypothetical protein